MIVEVNVADLVYKNIYDAGFKDALELVVKDKYTSRTCSLKKCKECFEDGSWCNLGNSVRKLLDDRNLQ